MDVKYDLIIIGGGPAGISAGIYSASRGIRTLLLETNELGGLIRNVSTVTHYLGIHEQESGSVFADRLATQARQAGFDIVNEQVKSVCLRSEDKKVYTDKHGYIGQKIILANGCRARKLGIPGEQSLAGKGMAMKASRDAAKFRDRNVYLVGGADGAVKEAIYLAGFAKTVSIIHFEDELNCIAEFKQKIKQLPNVQVRLHTRLRAVYGETEVSSFELMDVHSGEIERYYDQDCGIFVSIGTLPNTELYATELRLENGFIPTNEAMETEISGVYAAGDIRVKTVRQIATAVADGTIAAVHAAQNMKEFN